MACTVMVASGFTESENSPLAPVEVPLEVPRSSTVEPGRACPSARHPAGHGHVLGMSRESY